MQRALLIDVDGTLVDSNGAHADAWHRALARFGYRVDTGRLREMIGMGGDKILPSVDAALSDDTEPGKSIARERQQLFLTQYVQRLRPQPGARALLARAGLLGLRRVVATSAKRSELTPLLQTTGVADLIDDATTSDDAARSKPDADIIESGLALAGVPPERALYLGDTPYDVAAAVRAGVPCIALRCGGWDDRHLAGAVAIYDDPADLADHLNTSPLGRGVPS